MIRETSERISLLKQSSQSCQAASRGAVEVLCGLGERRDQMGRLPLLLTVFLRKKNDPDLCQQLGKVSSPHHHHPVVKVIKITAPTILLRATPSIGLFFLSARVTVSRTGGVELWAKTHQGITLPSPPSP